MNRYDGKVTIVTGGCRGIGLAIAEKFAEEGSMVVIADILEKESRESAEMIRAKGQKADYIVTDVSSVDSIYAMTTECVKRYGKIDALVACAGVQVRCPSMKLSEKDFDFVMDVNIKGMFFCNQAVGRVMRKQGGGVIVNISSDNCYSSHLGRAPYCISKRGVNALTAVLGAEWAMYGIRVNAVAPGWTNAPMPMAAIKSGILDGDALMSVIPAQRWGNPSEIADCVFYLSSDEATYMCGQTVSCDGAFNAFILPKALDYIKENDDMDY